MVTGNAICGGIPTFDPKGEPTSIALRYGKELLNCLHVVGKGVTDNKQKCALLLHCAGMDVQDIFDILSDIGEDKDYDKAIEAF